MIPVILLVILFLAFCVLTWQFTKTWRAPHIVFAFLTFLMAILFFVVASAQLKTRVTWQRHVEGLQQDVERLQTEKQLTAHGQPTAIEAEESLLAFKSKLETMLLDRGRVWRNLVPANVTNNLVVTLVVPQPVPQGQLPPLTPDGQPQAPPAAAEGEQPAPPPIETDTIVYAFKELETPEGYKVPVVFLGEFEVTGAAANQLTLTPTPTAQIDNQQLQQIRTPNSTWALYEMMPLDTHNAFEGLTAEQLQALMPQPAGVPPEAYQQLIQSYVRDLERAEDSDAPDSRWIKVRFIQPIPDDYAVVTGLFKEVDNVADQQPLNSDYFDLSGRAVTPHLRRGSLADFDIAKIEFAILDPQTAQQLIDDGYAEMVEPVFVRPLNDYAFVLHEIADRSRQVGEAIARVQRDIGLMQGAQQRVQTQIAYREDEKQKLQADLEKFAAEHEAITEYLNTLQNQLAETRNQLSTNYQHIHLLETQLDQVHQLLNNEIQRRVTEATAGR